MCLDERSLVDFQDTITLHEHGVKRLEQTPDSIRGVNGLNDLNYGN